MPRFTPLEQARLDYTMAVDRLLKSAREADEKRQRVMVLIDAQGDKSERPTAEEGAP